jgi:hypothetical protein
MVFKPTCVHILHQMENNDCLPSGEVREAKRELTTDDRRELSGFMVTAIKSISNRSLLGSIVANRDRDRLWPDGLKLLWQLEHTVIEDDTGITRNKLQDTVVQVSRIMMYMKACQSAIRRDSHEGQATMKYILQEVAYIVTSIDPGNIHALELMGQDVNFMVDHIMRALYE